MSGYGTAAQSGRSTSAKCPNSGKVRAIRYVILLVGSTAAQSRVQSACSLQVSCQESALESLVDEIVVQIIRASLPGIPAEGHSLGRAAPRELGVRILR
jgi:hypothetical protein